MKVAVVSSRIIKITNLGKYIPENTTEIISGGAKGVDLSVREYALSHNIALTEFLPDYKKYGRVALIKRNDLIVNESDMVIAFWMANREEQSMLLIIAKHIKKKYQYSFVKDLKSIFIFA